MSSKNLKDLIELLTELFKTREFERFLYFGPEGDKLVHALDFHQAPDDVFYEGTKLLERHGLVNRALFGRLAKERPRKCERIEAVERSILGTAATGGTHIVTLEAPIGGQPSLISSSEFHNALGGRAKLEHLRLNLNDLDVGAGRRDTWSLGQERIEAGVRRFLRDTVASSEERHVSVFGLAPIPWLMALGYALSETVPSRLFTRLRAPASWTWEAERPERDRWHWCRVGAPHAAHDAVILVSASAPVRPALVARALPGEAPTYAIALTRPRLDAVRCEVQIEEFGQVYREVLEAIEREVEGVERIHVFAAAPVAVAVDCGRRILHSAAPTIVAYHLHDGAYVRALELGG